MVSVLERRGGRKLNEMVVAESYRYVLKVPRGHLPDDVLEVTVIACSAHGAFRGGILYILEAVVEVDPEVFNVDVKGEPGTRLEVRAAELIVPDVLVITDTEVQSEQIVLGHGVAGVQPEH